MQDASLQAFQDQFYSKQVYQWLQCIQKTMKQWHLSLVFICIAASQAYLSGSVSTQCSITIRGCTDCNPLDASKCQLCTYNFSLNTVDYTCDCQNYFFLNQNKTQCLLCRDLFGLNCKSCSSSAFPENQTYCGQCNPGFYWNNLGCCSATLPNCANCSFDGNICFACANGTELVNGTCSSCQVECLICDPNIQCLQCRDTQTYLQNGKCLLCSQAISYCKLCLDALTCTECTSLDFYVNNGICKLCNETISNCTKCSSASNCLQCALGSIISVDSSTCISCSSLFADCLKCSNTWSCDECKAGQQFVNGLCQVKDNSGLGWVIILIICLGVVCVIIIAVCCFIKCKEKAKRKSILSSNQDIASTGSANNDNTMAKRLLE